MNKFSITLLLIASVAIAKCCNFNRYINIPSVVYSDEMDCLDSSYKGKSFLAYFYPGNWDEQHNFSINGNGQYNPIIKLEDNESFEFTLSVPRISEKHSYVGSSIGVKKIMFYFLEITPNNVASVNISYDTLHLPIEVPLVYHVVANLENSKIFSMTLRADDLNVIESVHLINKQGDSIKSVPLKAGLDSTYKTESLSYSDDSQKIYLEIKLNSRKQEDHYFLKQFIQADIFFEDHIRYSYINNVPDYVLPGQILIKRTEVNSYDDFIVEFPEDILEVVEASLTSNGEIVKYQVIQNNRLHVNFDREVPSPNGFQEYISFEIKFLVKGVPKISQQILVARYDLEELRETNGFIVKGSYYDDQVFYKASPEVFLNNNVYLASSLLEYKFSGEHEIHISYDQVPKIAKNIKDFARQNTLDIHKLEIDIHQAKKSKLVYICLKRVGGASETSLLSLFEIIITKDFYYLIDRKEKDNTKIPYSLVNGQSLYIINYGLDLEDPTTFFPKDSQVYSIKSTFGKYKAYANYQNEYINRYKVPEYNALQVDWRFSSIKNLFDFNRKDEFVSETTFHFTKFETKSEGSLLKLAAITDTSGVIEIQGHQGKNRFGFRTFLE